MYLISAYFDDNTNRILRRHIEKIARETGNDFMIKNNVPPHLTISAIEARNADVLIPAFEKLCKNDLADDRLKSREIKFVTVGQLFPYVIYTAPVMNEMLLTLSNGVYDAFSNIPDTSVSRLYRPFSWIPHITLAKTLDKEQMVTAFKVMQCSFASFTGEIVRMGLSTVNPHKDVMVYNM